MFRPLLVALLLYGSSLPGQSASQPRYLSDLNRNRSYLDAHNCYPYDGKFTDRIDRALSTGLPVAIEQDIAWHVDPASGTGVAVVSHKPDTDGSEPALRNYFFEKVRPLVERALRENNRSNWPMIVVHFDFKDNRPELLRAVNRLLAEYDGWITGVAKSADIRQISPLDVRPLLVLTEDPDAQQNVFYDDLPSGTRLRIFGSAHTHIPAEQDRQKLMHLVATMSPQELLPEPANDYRRWWNNSWAEVEEGGQRRAADWTEADAARLKSLVEHAHQQGYWIRFYTLDGFQPETGRVHGWFETYNFGSPEAAQLRWDAAIRTGVDLIATDQFEDFSNFRQSTGKTAVNTNKQKLRSR